MARIWCYEFSCKFCNRGTKRRKCSLHLQKLDTATTEEERVIHDKKIHYLLIAASQNKYMMLNFVALTEIMDLYIPTMRGKNSNFYENWRSFI